MIHYDQCPVCHSSHIQKIFAAKDYTVSQELFEIWQCAHCSLRFTQDVPALDAIGNYYRSEDYISHTETTKGIVNALYLQVRKITLRSKKRFVEDQTGITRGNILDVGAGTGAFLHFMQQHGWQTEGLEPDQGAIARAEKQYGLKLKSPNELFRLPAASFDAITLWHVLEHVHQLHDYMQQLKSLLKPGGRLFIAVPNYTSYDAIKYGAHWAAYDVPRHLYHFSPAAMHELSNRHGLSIIKWQPMWFDSFYVSMLSEKYKNGGAGLVPGFLRGLRSNSKALSNARKASSLIYVLKIA